MDNELLNIITAIKFNVLEFKVRMKDMFFEHLYCVRV